MPRNKCIHTEWMMMMGQLLGRLQLHQLPVVVHRPRRTDPCVDALARRTRRLVPLDLSIGEIRLEQFAQLQFFLVGARQTAFRLIGDLARTRAGRVATQHDAIG